MSAFFKWRGIFPCLFLCPELLILLLCIQGGVNCFRGCDIYLYVIWDYNNAYNGDFYIYPMVRKGFQESKVLKIFHYNML